MVFSNSTHTPAALGAGETRREALLRLGIARPRFLQGIYPFVGRGIFELGPLHDDLTYMVPEGATAEVAYVRAGNASDDLLTLALSLNGKPLRYFPLGPKSDSHVELAIVESHPPGSRLALWIAAPRGLTGAVIIDVGLVELRQGEPE